MALTLRSKGTEIHFWEWEDDDKDPEQVPVPHTPMGASSKQRKEHGNWCALQKMGPAGQEGRLLTVPPKDPEYWRVSRCVWVYPTGPTGSLLTPLLNFARTIFRHL